MLFIAGVMSAFAGQAYKAVKLQSGVMFFFEEVKPFRDRNVAIIGKDNRLAMQIGENICLLNELIIRHLLKTKTVFLYECKRDNYISDHSPAAFEIEEFVLTRLKNIWEENKRKVAETTSDYSQGMK